ncbi:MAG: hypothetical protein K6A33_03715 [Clostridiales bacterium]|nr:hypothetical protein [Clostridiales bacterium]
MKAKVPRMYSEAYLNEYIMKLDMLALLVLNREFGFGPRRLRKYYRAIYDWEQYYAKFRDGDPGYGKKSKDGKTGMELWKLKKDLYDIGFDYDAEVRDAEEDEA